MNISINETVHQIIAGSHQKPDASSEKISLITSLAT